MKKNTTPAALSHQEYLERKLHSIEKKIDETEESQGDYQQDLKELYFQKGKIFAEIQLVKRIPSYE